jgi:hypothetical protein
MPGMGHSADRATEGLLSMRSHRISAVVQRRRNVQNASEQA